LASYRGLLFSQICLNWDFSSDFGHFLFKRPKIAFLEGILSAPVVLNLLFRFFYGFSYDVNSEGCVNLLEYPLLYPDGVQAYSLRAGFRLDLLVVEAYEAFGDQLLLLGVVQDLVAVDGDLELLPTVVSKLLVRGYFHFFHRNFGDFRRVCVDFAKKWRFFYDGEKFVWVSYWSLPCMDVDLAQLVSVDIDLALSHAFILENWWFELPGGK